LKEGKVMEYTHIPVQYFSSKAKLDIIGAK
jgi:hypothetical protein